MKKETFDPTETSDKNCGCHFEFQNPEALEVFIAGSFNNWNPSAAPMVHLADGRWVKELILPSGRYEYRFVMNGFQSWPDRDDRPGRYGYRFVVNGQWVDDPNARKLAPNPHGGFNAVLIVGQN